MTDHRSPSRTYRSCSIRRRLAVVEGSVLDATICDVRQEELVGPDPPMPAQIRPERIIR